MFHRGQRTVQQLSASARLVSDMELRLNRNITSSVARSLQELSAAFRSSQSAYLKSMHSFVVVMVLVINFKQFSGAVLMVEQQERKQITATCVCEVDGFTVIQSIYWGGAVAQWAERWTCNQQVVGLNTTRGKAVLPPWSSCSHLCASVTSQYNLVPAKGQ